MTTTAIRSSTLTPATAATPAVLQVEHLRKSYGDRVAVADVSFAVREGEVFGRRWGIESFMSGLKRMTGTALAARGERSLFVEAALRVMADALRRSSKSGQGNFSTRQNQLLAKRHKLTQTPWLAIRELLPGKTGDPGGTAANNRLFVNAVLFVAKTAASQENTALV